MVEHRHQARRGRGSAITGELISVACMSWLASVNFNAMNYQKVIEELEHHASEAAEFLASYPDPDEMESEKAAHRAMVCAVHALRELTQERAAHLEAMQYTVSVDKILRPDERHTRLEELLALANVQSEPRLGDALTQSQPTKGNQ